MIWEVSQGIQKLLLQELYPQDLLQSDGIQLCVPQHGANDYQIGIYLYDMEEDHLHEQHYAKVIDHQRVYPPKMMILHYLIFVNEETSFGGYNKEQEEHLLFRLLQCIHDHGILQIQESEVQVSFDSLDLENKIRLWQSLHKPLQPALYIRVSPIQIPSKKVEDIQRVKHVDIHTVRKE